MIIYNVIIIIIWKHIFKAHKACTLHLRTFVLCPCCVHVEAQTHLSLVPVSFSRVIFFPSFPAFLKIGAFVWRMFYTKSSHLERKLIRFRTCFHNIGFSFLLIINTLFYVYIYISVYILYLYLYLSYNIRHPAMTLSHIGTPIISWTTLRLGPSVLPHSSRPLQRQAMRP